MPSSRNLKMMKTTLLSAIPAIGIIALIYLLGALNESQDFAFAGMLAGTLMALSAVAIHPTPLPKKEGEDLPEAGSMFRKQNRD